MKVTTRFEPAISVVDFERMLHFYRDVLGMNVFSIDEIPATQATLAQLSMDGYRIARLETDGRDRLKIVSAARKPKPQAEASHVLDRHGFSYLTFIVPDLQKVIDRLVAAGIPLKTGPDPVAFRPGVVKLAFAQDPEGNFLEFVERNDLITYRPHEVSTFG